MYIYNVYMYVYNVYMCIMYIYIEYVAYIASNLQYYSS